MTARFRLAGPDDLDLVKRGPGLRREDLVGEFTAEEGYPYERGPVRDMLQRLLGHDDVGRVWLVLDGDEVAGYAALCFGWSIEYRGRDAVVDELFVRPAFRGRGHGTALLRMGARRLYERLGYAGKDRALMTRRLRAAGLPSAEGH